MFEFEYKDINVYANMYVYIRIYEYTLYVYVNEYI